jgi:hypothetical protein
MLHGEMSHLFKSLTCLIRLSLLRVCFLSLDKTRYIKQADFYDYASFSFGQCVLPAGVEFHSSGFVSSDPASFPRSYPIVLTEGDGSKIFVSCIAFRDRVCEDIIEAYRLPPNTYADKCICLVSHAPNFRVLRNSLEEIFVLCFSSEGSWYIPLRLKHLLLVYT